MRRPQLWIAPTLAGAVLGPVSTCILKMTNTPAGAGMGTCGLVGQFGAIAAMGDSLSTSALLFQIALMHFILPGVLTFIFHMALTKAGWVHIGDLRIAAA